MHRENMKMLHEESVTFMRDWFHLRGRLYYDEGVDPSCAVLLCSPHPHFGGDMENNVISHVARALSERGSAVMIFDYSGVGNSEGPWKNEMEQFEFWESATNSEDYRVVVPDAEAALDHLLKCLPSRPETILVGGYSFGAVVALRLAYSRKVSGVFGISPPVGEYDLEFAKSIDCPKYFILSDDDMACSTEEMMEFCERVNAGKGLSIMPGENHFYVGNESRLCSTLMNHLEPHLGSGPT
jgi:alpha/beta superfamily hydrolase